MASPSFSGSTMLSIILGTHPAISTVGELKGISHRGNYKTFKCSSGNLMIESPFWIDMEREMQILQMDFSLQNFHTNIFYPAQSSLGHLANLPYYQILNSLFLDDLKDRCMRWIFHNRYRHILRAVNNSYYFAKILCQKENSSIFLDSSKDVVALKYLKKYMGQEVEFKLIHLVRDSRAVVNSFVKKNKAKSVTDAAQYWKKTHEKIESVKKNFFKQENCITVYYEQFCQEPENELKKLSNFLGIVYNYKIANIDNNEHHIIGNSTRLKPIEHIRSDFNWKTNLSAEQLKEIHNITGAVNQYYGFQ